MTDDQSLARFMKEAAEEKVLIGIFGNSPYLSQSLLREPACLRDFLEKGADETFKGILTALCDEIKAATDSARVMTLLRLAKRRAALVIALADITNVWPLKRITAAITDLADTTTSLAVSHLLRQAHEAGEIELAHPQDPERDCGYIIIAMGKQGAFELNYSSDIDLIVLYDPDKVVYRGKRTVKELFVRMTRDLIKIMEERTAEGYVFRTDLRLRPDPGSTPPAISLIAAETYYEGHGQNWERAAMIKARCVAGDKAAGRGFLSYLRPFIWRKSLDFHAIQDVHSIKRQIHAHKGGGTIAVAGHNIKLGRGGIREIEFFAQTQQLIWGGRQPELQTSGTLESLKRLTDLEHVAEETRAKLEEAYIYLRTLEHRLQMIDDQQTQTLPQDPEKLRALAVFMGYEGTEAFSKDLIACLEAVEDAYAELFEEAPSLAKAGNLVFTGGEDDPETLKTIEGMGYENPSAVAAVVRAWHHGRYRATRSTRAKELLTELVPTLLQAFAASVKPDQAFLRFDEFLKKLPGGVQVFSLFQARPELLELVAEIMGDAPRLAEMLSRDPSLLYGVLTRDFFAPLADLIHLSESLDAQLAEAEAFEEVLNQARRWVNDHKFRMGVQILRHMVSAEQAGLSLTAIAETAVHRLMPRVERELARAHGYIPDGGLVLIAMGKAGGREMSSTSDLDLILVYDTPEGVTESTGPRKLGLSVFYARATQRLINAITVKTNEGSLYEVDMRLRPSGNAGPIAASFEAFEKYHREAAWTWEHMALTKARVIYGQPDLTERVEALMRETLLRPRDPDQLVIDVADMRKRLSRERKAKSLWEVKYHRGGLIDVEFLAQYLQLRHAHAHPDILAVHTARALENIQSIGVLTAEQAQTLIEAYSLYMTLQNVLRLTAGGAIDEETAPEGLKARLVTACGSGDFTTLRTRIKDYLKRTHTIFRDLIEEPAEKARQRQEETNP